MQEVSDERTFELPTSVMGRFGLGVRSSLVVAVMGTALYWVLFQWRPQQPVEWALRLFAESALVAQVALAVAGLVWAIAKPRWAEHLYAAAEKRLAWLGGLWVLVVYVPLFGFGLLLLVAWLLGLL